MIAVVAADDLDLIQPEGIYARAGLFLILTVDLKDGSTQEKYSDPPLAGFNEHISALLSPDQVNHRQEMGLRSKRILAVGQLISRHDRKKFVFPTDDHPLVLHS